MFILFCKFGFNKSIHQNHSRKATLCTLKPPNLWPRPRRFQVFFAVFKRLNATKIQVSMRKGSTPICHYGSPLTLNSQIAPSTGRREHLLKSFIDYAFFSGFLGPPSQIDIATRITHHIRYFSIF